MTIIISHRGITEKGQKLGLTENTIPMIQTAINNGVDMIEIDVHLTNDKKWVIHHNDSIMGMKKRITTLNSKELVEFAEKNHYQIHFLDDVLTTFPDCNFNIECKTQSTNAGQQLFDTIKNFDLSKISISSFSLSVLFDIRQHSIDVQLSFLSSYQHLIPWKPITKLNRMLNLTSYNPNNKFLSKFHLMKLQNNGVKLRIWTVNEKNELRSLMSHKVDGIITNYPERAISLRNNFKDR